MSTLYSDPWQFIGWLLVMVIHAIVAVAVFSVLFCLVTWARLSYERRLNRRWWAQVKQGQIWTDGTERITITRVFPSKIFGFTENHGLRELEWKDTTRYRKSLRQIDDL